MTHPKRRRTTAANNHWQAVNQRVTVAPGPPLTRLKQQPSVYDVLMRLISSSK